MIRAVAAIKDLNRTKRDALPGILVVTGAEEYLRAEVRQALLRRLGEDVDVLPFDPEAHEDVAVDLLDELCTGSLFGSGKVIVVEGASGVVNSCASVLESILKDPPEARLVLDDESLVTRRGKKVTMPKALQALEEKGAWVVDCEPLHASPYGFGKAAWDHELARWIVQRAEVAKKKIELPVAHALASRVGSGLRGIASELDKLILQVGEGERILMSHVDAAIRTGEEATIFELVDAFGARDLDGTIAAANRLFDRGVKDERGHRSFRSTDIVARAIPMIARRLRELGRLVEMTRRGDDFDEAVEAVLGRGRGWLGRKLRPQLDARDPRELGDAVVALCETETALKRSAGDARDLLMRFLVEHARGRIAIAAPTVGGSGRGGGPFSGRPMPR
ncbi:MAG: hypothetical protein R3F20_08330 [Planctomycetota bacterium]